MSMVRARAARQRCRVVFAAIALSLLGAVPADAQVGSPTNNPPFRDQEFVRRPDGVGRGFLIDQEAARLPADTRRRYAALIAKLKGHVIRCELDEYRKTLAEISAEIGRVFQEHYARGERDLRAGRRSDPIPAGDLAWERFAREIDTLRQENFDRLFGPCFRRVTLRERTPPPGPPAPREPTREERELREQALIFADLIPELTSLAVEPYVMFGARSNRADGSYSSTGAQAAGAGTGNETRPNFCGGVQGWISLPLFGAFLADEEFRGRFIILGRTEFGGRFGVCYLGDGNKVVFREVRHPGGDGRVTISERERTEILAHFFIRQTFGVNLGGVFDDEGSLGGEQFAAASGQNPGAARRLGRYWPVTLYVGGGPSFVSSVIDLTSNQTGAGGAIETSQRNKLDTAWSLTVGGQTALCLRCVAGSPIMVGVEGTWTWLPTRDATVTSRAFGFTETGRVSNRASTRVMVTLSVPFRL